MVIKLIGVRDCKNIPHWGQDTERTFLHAKRGHDISRTKSGAKAKASG